MSVLSAPRFNDEHAAYAWVEAKLWPDGPVCPHCGATDRIKPLSGKSTRIGVRKCYHCYKPFTVKVGTIFEDSHVPMYKWLQAFHLMCSSKKGISSNQLHRILEVSLKTAWFMSHRLREAMRDGGFAPLGGSGVPVEADETFIGRKEGVPVPKGGYSHKHAVLALVERGGKVRSVHLDRLTKAEVGKVVRENVTREAWLFTDESRLYREVGAEFAGHSRVHHALGEYVDPDDATINTQTVEGYFSIFKRGMKGVYQHCAEKHLHRYLAEFDFRYNNRVRMGIDDAARAERALLGVTGKRLTYRQPRVRPAVSVGT
jgi:transposase-like protein